LLLLIRKIGLGKVGEGLENVGGVSIIGVWGGGLVVGVLLALPA